MFQKIYYILEEILGKSKQGFYDPTCHQYQWGCPCCAHEKGVSNDGKNNLEVSFKLGKYHCWACGDTHNTKGSLSKLIKEYGNKEQLNKYWEEINNIKTSKLYSLDCFKDDEVIIEENYTSLPKTFKKIDIKTCKNKKLLNFLKKRKITQDIIDRYNIGYTDYNEIDFNLKNRIIIPSYSSYNELNFWTGRDFTDNPKRLKYFNLKTDKKEIVYLENNLNYDNDIVIVEGALDTIYLPNATALLGKTLKKDSALFKNLYNKANAKIIICLDGDTNIIETKKIYNILNIGRLRNKIYYIRLGEEDIPYKDFGEIYETEGKKGIIKTVKNIKQFKEIELLI